MQLRANAAAAVPQVRERQLRHGRARRFDERLQRQPIVLVIILA
jgi:hypothetical protein